MLELQFLYISVNDCFSTTSLVKTTLTAFIRFTLIECHVLVCLFVGVCVSLHLLIHVVCSLSFLFSVMLVRMNIKLLAGLLDLHTRTKFTR